MLLLVLFNRMYISLHVAVFASHKLSAVLMYLCVKTCIDAKHHLFVFRKYFQNLAYSWNLHCAIFYHRYHLCCESPLEVYQLRVLSIK